MAESNQLRYYVRVTAGNKPVLGSMVARKKAPSGNFKEISACLGVCCDNIANLLATPFDFVASNGATTVINLAWDAVPGATNYRLERSTAANFTTALATAYFGTALSYADTGRTMGVTYYYRLSAVGASTSGFATTSHVSP